VSGPKYLGTMDDWMRDQEKRVTSVERRRRRVPAGGGGGQTTISVSDTGTIDLTLTGDSSAGYGLSGRVIAVPVSLLTGPGTIAPALLPAAVPTPVSVTDTATVDLTLTGAGTAASPWNIKADVVGVGVPTPLTVTDTATIDLTLTGAGTAVSPWNIKADLIGGGATGTPVTPGWGAGFRSNTAPLGPSVINKVGTKVVIDRFIVENATSLTLGTNGQVVAGTMPVGSRPTVEVRLPATVNATATFMDVGQVILGTDGTITLQTAVGFSGLGAGAVAWTTGSVSYTAA